MNDNSPVTPQLFFDTIVAFQRSAAIKSAVELDVFTKIAEGSNTSTQIAAACEAAERGIRILCDSLTVMGFLKKENDLYELTEASAAFLDRRSPTYVGGAVDFILSEAQMRGFNKLTEAVKNGGSVVSGEASLDPESPMWVKFARGMMGMMFPASQMIAENLGFEAERKLKVLDIAAGHVIFGISVARKYPNAEIYAVDWSNVLQVASENAARMGVGERHHLIPGSAFDVEFGEGYDVVLLTNFLHHFDPQTCEELLKKIRKSLADDGKVVTLEFIPNEDRVTPAAEAMFSLVMMAATPAGDAYTFAELKEMFENAGFSQNQHLPLPGLPQHLVISMK